MNKNIGELIKENGFGGAFPWAANYDSIENNNSLIDWLYEGFGTETWIFIMAYPEYIRIITQSKDVDIHALIGNIGGYVGLFLGIDFM